MNVISTTQPALPKPVTGSSLLSKPATSSGLLSSMPKPLAAPTSNFVAPLRPGAGQGPVAQGSTYNGFLNSSPSNTHVTTTKSPTGTVTTSKPVPNPAVLAQQKELNKLGAGLVEDGIIGDKTRAAIAKYSNQSTPQSQQTPETYQVPPETDQTQNTPDYSNTYGEAVTGLLNKSEPSQEYLDAQAEAKRISDEQTALTNDFAKKDMNINRTAGFLTQATGLEGQLQNQYNIGQAALSSQYAGATNRLGAANTQQGLQQGALSSAGSLASPQMQFGQLTNPLSGGVIGADKTGNNPLYTKALQSAIQMFNSGATQADAMAASGLNNFGSKGATEFATAIQGGGDYNPTAYNAITGANINQGLDYKKAAVDLDTSLKQLNTITPVAVNFLNANGLLNQSNSKHENDAINTYVAEFKDPAGAAQYAMILGDIKKFTSTILASNNGTIPTDMTNTLNTFDPSTLSAKQLVPWLQTLKQLGDNQLSVLQGQTQSLIPQTKKTTTPQKNYVGAPTKETSNPTVAPKTTGTPASKAGYNTQGLIGTGLNLWNKVSGFVGSIFK